jgi:hypothetical protein
MSKYQREKQFCLKLANAVAKIDNKQVQSGFQMIKNYRLAKDYVYEAEKKHATKDAYSILDKLYSKKMNDYLSHFRTVSWNMKASEAKRRAMFKHVISRGVRQAFMTWKKRADELFTEEEVNDCGPVVEDVLEAKLDIKNCIKMLTEEGFTPQQIAEFEEKAEARNLDKLRKSIGHWRAYTLGEDDDSRLLPIFINRWKQYVVMRKILKRWLNVITDQADPIKADMRLFFDRWRFHFADKEAALQNLTKDQCLRRAVNAQKRLN